MDSVPQAEEDHEGRLVAAGYIIYDGWVYFSEVQICYEEEICIYLLHLNNLYYLYLL